MKVTKRNSHNAPVRMELGPGDRETVCDNCGKRMDEPLLWWSRVDRDWVTLEMVGTDYCPDCQDDLMKKKVRLTLESLIRTTDCQIRKYTAEKQSLEKLLCSLKG